MKLKKVKSGAGFTLIEILVVIGIIAVLAAIVLVAINPAKRFADANDAQRKANINTILNAIGQNIVDHKGAFATSSDNGTKLCSDSMANGGEGVTIPTVLTEIGGTGLQVNVNACLDGYLTQFPVDPTKTSYADGAGYEILRTSSGAYTVSATLSDGTTVYSVTR